MEIVILAATTLGFISLCKQILRFLFWVWAMFWRRPKDLKKYGSWVMITGATDGIGKALALELASKGLNLILVGRNPEKIEATIRELRERCGTEVRINNIVLDFAKCDGEEISERIMSGIEGLDVGILVNNAGDVNRHAMYFHEAEMATVENIVKVNAEAATWVVRAVLPAMLKKKKGAIINIGSASSLAVPSFPFYSVYASTKAYLAMFSRCISLEYSHHGIDVQCQIPLFVSTKMSNLKQSTFFVASPETYARASIRWMGYEQLCAPIWSQSVQWFILSALPDGLLNWAIFRFFLEVRKKGLQKGSPRKKTGVNSLYADDIVAEKM
uniref:Steroid dehydrogenase n=1 Tax=Rhizophora mucronata TaxID=61149 RepID=A0A2P2QL66_RHIMU